MKGRLVIIALAFVAVCCSQPPSYEPFVIREKAEYGDTYSFMVDVSDSLARYSLDFYTRLERAAFGEFPSDSIVLDLRWFSPSDSIFTDTAFVKIVRPVDSAYYSKDFISPYSGSLELPERGNWRLKAKVVNDSQALRGLGIILKRY